MYRPQKLTWHEMTGISAMTSGAYIVLQAGCLLSDHNFCVSILSQMNLLNTFYLTEFLRWHYQLSCKLNWNIERWGFFFILLFWIIAVPVFISVMNNSKHWDMGSLVFLPEAYFAWDWLAKLSSCSGSYWLELRSFPPQTVLIWWKAGSLAKFLIGPSPARLLASKTRFRSQKENMKGEDFLCL